MDHGSKADSMTSSAQAGAPSRRPRRTGKAPKRNRSDWLEYARTLLVERGVEGVKVEPLAKLLGVTTGSFYHHFKNRQELLTDLLEHWERHNSAPLFQAVESAGPDPDAQIDALFETWISENDYDPVYDAAVRAWAHVSAEAAGVVRRVDDLRIDLLQRVFQRYGYDEERAFIRARVTYFHQVGYQAMEIRESARQRRSLRHLYREVLVGDVPRKP
jgi:AcrR family transcriptional regulator